MVAPAGSTCPELLPADLQERFLAIRPRILVHARIYFRHVRCGGRKADAIAETVALAWKWFVRLARRGKDARRFPSVLASFAARAVRSGRRLCGQERVRDVLSPVAQQRHGFSVSKTAGLLHGEQQPAGRGAGGQPALAGARPGAVPHRLPGLAAHAGAGVTGASSTP